MITTIKQATPQPRRVTLVLALVAVLSSSCATRSSVNSTWHDTASREQRFDKVLVIGMTADGDRRVTYEDTVAQALQSDHTQAWPSSQFMEIAQAVTPETVQRVVDQVGANAIVVTQVSQLNVQAVEVEAFTDVLARRQSGTAFRYDYIEKERAPYTTAEYTAVLTTDVYAADSGAHLYTMVASTRGKVSLDETAIAFGKLIAMRLKKDGVVR